RRRYTHSVTIVPYTTLFRSSLARTKFRTAGMLGSMPDQSLTPDLPASVHPPGAESFEQTALVWLFEHVPADYRLHGVLRRHPVAELRAAGNRQARVRTATPGP